MSEASLSLEAQEVLRKLLSPLHHEGAHTVFLTNKKLSLDERLESNGKMRGSPGGVEGEAQKRLAKQKKRSKNKTLFSEFPTSSEKNKTKTNKMSCSKNTCKVIVCASVKIGNFCTQNCLCLN